MEEDIDTMEEAFDTIPPEVQDYVYSDEFEEKIKTLFSEIGFDEEKQKEFRGELFGFIAQIDDDDDLIETINQLSPDEGIRTRIKEWIVENVYQKILSLVTNAYVFEEDDDDEQDSAGEAAEISTTKVPSQSLSSLADRLKQSSIAPSAKRDYSLDTKKPLSEEASTHTTDPYHEPIDL